MTEHKPTCAGEGCGAKLWHYVAFENNACHGDTEKWTQKNEAEPNPDKWHLICECDDTNLCPSCVADLKAAAKALRAWRDKARGGRYLMASEIKIIDAACPMPGETETEEKKSGDKAPE